MIWSIYSDMYWEKQWLLLVVSSNMQAWPCKKSPCVQWDYVWVCWGLKGKALAIPLHWCLYLGKQQVWGCCHPCCRSVESSIPGTATPFPVQVGEWGEAEPCTQKEALCSRYRAGSDYFLSGARVEMGSINRELRIWVLVKARWTPCMNQVCKVRLIWWS